MPKKKANSVGTLSSYWCPPTDVLDGTVGEPIACVASTFEFDAAFFEAELLPRFLGLKFDHTENEQTFLVEREEKLALTSTAVLVDIHKTDPGQTTLRWDQVPIAVPGSQSIQHSKIVLLAWEHMVRLIVGSANLTRPGYRRNREVFAALDFFDDEESLPRRPVEDAIRLLEQILKWSRVPDGTRSRTIDTLSLVRQKLASWTAIPKDFRPREKPKVSFVATLPSINGQSPLSALDQVTSLWGSRSVSEIKVFTPFVGKPDGERDRVVQRLAAIPRSRDCVGWLIAPRHPAEESDPVIRVALPESFGNAWHECFDSRGGGQVLAIPQFVKGVDKINRILHSKVLSLEDADHLLLMIGSSNFTPHGMGIGVFNVEANLLFEDPSDEAWPRIELPISRDDWNAVEDVQWDEHFEPTEDTVDHAVMLPRFFVCASYSQVTGMLKLTLDRTCPEPSEWTIRLKGVDMDGLPVFSHSSNQDMEMLTYTFPDESRSASLAALLVAWIDDTGQARQAQIIVSIESKDDLVASEQFRAFGVDAMIDCLVHGRSLAEWQERQINRRTLGIGLNEALDSLRSVDTSGYLLYQVRRFGRALSGLCERLERVVLLPTAVRYRLFRDPLGPISLGNALMNISGSTSSLSTLSDEHRLFLLTELLLSVARTTHQMLKQTDKKTRKWLKEVVREAIAVLAGQVSSRREALASTLASNMEQYLSAAMTEATDLVGQLPTEVANAG
jgi:phosphatidylserine/phosphatidylglycerophosphate/cardiolipin synthase-like enzyme